MSAKDGKVAAISVRGCVDLRGSFRRDLFNHSSQLSLLTSDDDALERDRVADHVGPHGAEGLLPALVEDSGLLRGH